MIIMQMLKIIFINSMKSNLKSSMLMYGNNLWNKIIVCKLIQYLKFKKNINNKQILKQIEIICLNVIFILNLIRLIILLIEDKIQISTNNIIRIL